MLAFGLRDYEISVLFMVILCVKVSYSFKIGCALNLLIWASSLSILSLSSISLCTSSSCLTKLSSSKGSGFVHCFGSGFGGSYTKVLKIIGRSISNQNNTNRISKYNLIKTCIPQGNQSYKDTDSPLESEPSPLPTVSVSLPSQISFPFPLLFPPCEGGMDLVQCSAESVFRCLALNTMKAEEQKKQ